MKVVLFAVKDLAVAAFQMPQSVAHIGGAVRWFSDQCKSDGLYGKHPADFELYELGWFGDGDAHFELHKSPELIVRGKDLARPE